MTMLLLVLFGIACGVVIIFVEVLVSARENREAQRFQQLMHRNGCCTTCGHVTGYCGHC